MKYRFGEYSIDDQRLELRRGGRTLEVQPKVLDLLIYLIRERERVVSRQELLDRLWGDAEVVEAVLTTAVHEARTALGDSADRQWAIKTVQRRGYRFVAPLDQAPAPIAVERPPPSRYPWMADVFVGREDVLAHFAAALGAAAAGRGRTVVVTGESGIGKTRLLDELASRSGMEGALVLPSWCYEGEGTPPYWPWVQVLRTAIAGQSPEDALLDMGAGAADLAALVPAIHELRPDLPEPLRLRSGPSRFRLFESVTTFLANAAKRRPILILVDDLHSADHASLRLLGFLAHEVRHARILAAVTVRTSEIGADRVLEETLAELARHSPGERIQLEGLSAAETGQLIERLTGREASQALARTIAERSEGNPFLVKEIVSLLQTQGQIEEEPDAWMSSVPPGVRDVILRRLHRRSATCQEVLALAAVLGREFRRDLLEQLIRLSEEDLTSALEEACAAGILQELRTPDDHYRFTHVLTQETLYAQWSASERARWHGRTGEALEALAASGPSLPPAEFAHHFLRASEEGSAEKAVDYAVRAAEHAVAVYAQDEAVKYYGRALEALEHLEVPDDTRRFELLLALGTAQLDARRSDPSGRESLLRAARLAREAGEPDKLARAAHELAAVAHRSGPGDPVLIELLEGAISDLGEGNEALRARLMADLAIQRLSAATLDEGTRLSEDAVALARKTDDLTALGETLNLRCSLLSGPEHVRERLGQAESLLELASETGNAELALFGHRWRLVSMLELGEMEAADSELAAYEEAAEEARAWTARWYALTVRATRAFIDGRIDEAERFTLDAFAQKRHEPTPLTVYAFGAQLLWLRREQGRIGELARFARAQPVDSRFPMLAVFRATIALLHAEEGSLDEARAELERFTSNQLADLPRDFTYLYGLAVLGELCAAVGDSESAATIYDALRPFDDRFVVLFMGTVCLGSASRYLGQLAATMGRWEEAEAHFSEAAARNQRIGARLWVAHTQLDWARMLHAQGGRDASPRGLDLLRPCLATAAELGLVNLEERARSLAAQLRPT